MSLWGLRHSEQRVSPHVNQAQGLGGVGAEFVKQSFLGFPTWFLVSCGGLGVRWHLFAGIKNRLHDQKLTYNQFRKDFLL